MKKTFKIFTLLIALVACLGIFSFTADAGPVDPVVSITEKSSAFVSVVSAEAKPWNLEDPEGVERIETSHTAFQDQVKVTDQGKLTEKIARGLAQESPFYQYRSFRYQSAIQFGRKTAFALKASVPDTRRLIYDLPPNLRSGARPWISFTGKCSSPN